jgi:hypothetical protein
MGWEVRAPCLPGLLGLQTPGGGQVQRGRNAGAIPTGGRLGEGARDGTSLVCGVARGCFPLRGFHKAASLWPGF